MASFSLYDVAVPTFTRGLKTLDHILVKAEEFAKEKGIDVNTFVQARLIEDQLPLAFQVQNTTRVAITYADHLTGKTTAPLANDETTIAQLRARIQTALAVLKAVDPAVANAITEKNTAEFKIGGKPVTLTIQNAVLQQGIPNFIFHLTTAYSILRSKGVPVGKTDYISSFVFN